MLDQCLHKKGPTTAERMQVLLQVSRAITFNQTYMVPKIYKSLPELSDLLVVSHDQVTLLDQDRFQELVAVTMGKHVGEELEEVERVSNNSQKSRASKLRRWLRLWSPMDARLSLSGVVWPDGSIATSPSEQASALSSHWTPVFSKKPSNENLARRILSSSQPRFDDPILEDEYTVEETLECFEKL